MKAGYIDFGEHEGKTLEEICFKDFPYVDWILREVEANRWEVNRWVIGHLEHLFDVARAKSVRGPCAGDETYKTNCRRAPDTFSIPEYRGRASPGIAWRICSDPYCQNEVLREAHGGIVLYEISFEGFRDFVRRFRTEGEAKDFGIQLVKAWGIVGPKERLTKKRIFEFFGVEK